jgi:hypothetical protein
MAKRKHCKVDLPLSHPTHLQNLKISLMRDLSTFSCVSTTHIIKQKKHLKFQSFSQDLIVKYCAIRGGGGVTQTVIIIPNAAATLLSHKIWTHKFLSYLTAPNYFCYGPLWGPPIHIVIFQTAVTNLLCPNMLPPNFSVPKESMSFQNATTKFYHIPRAVNARNHPCQTSVDIFYSVQ